MSYSGRLLYHQACASVILTPPPNYLLHTTHLMRPLFSSTLALSSSSGEPIKYNKLSSPSPRWPKSYPPSEANIIFVDALWADLEATVQWLEENPKVAEGIAKRQREMFVGYMTTAAEVCYWRSLIRAWASVAVVEDESIWRDKDGGEGMRWETFSLRHKMGYLV